MKIIKLVIPAIALLASCNSNTETTSTEVLDTAKVMNSKYSIAFQIDDKIVATNEDTTKQVSFGGASDAAISYDGNKLAYTVIDSVGNKSIWYADMQNKSQNQILINSRNYYQSIWSPNAERLAFIFETNDKTSKVALSNLNNTEHFVFDQNSKDNYYNPTWKSNSELVFHNTEKLFHIKTDGTIISETPINTILDSKYPIDKKTRFFYINNGEDIVFNSSTGEIYKVNIQNKNTQQVSVAKVKADYLYVTPSSDIIYSGRENDNGFSKIYESNLDGKTHKVIINKGENPSAN